MTPSIGKACTALFDSRWKIDEIPNARSQTGTTKCRAGLRISWVCTNLPLRTGLFYFSSAVGGSCLFYHASKRILLPSGPTNPSFPRTSFLFSLKLNQGRNLDIQPCKVTMPDESSTYDL